MGDPQAPAEVYAVGLRIAPDPGTGTADGGNAAVPASIPLLPAAGDGGVIESRDGRMFFADDIDAAIRRTFADSPDGIPIDTDHAIEIFGGPAMGWIRSIEASDDGALSGAVEWTAEGSALVSARSYRYVSPAFIPTDDGGIDRFTSAALTNRPALRMPALTHKGRSKMKTQSEIFAALGIEAGGDPLVAIEALKADREVAVSLAASLTERAETMIPREQFDALAARFDTLRAESEASKLAAFEAARDRLIGAALETGKITPASAAHYAALASDAAGLENLRRVLDTMPSVFAETPAGIQAPAPTAQPDDHDLRDHYARLFGLNVSDIEAHRTKLANQGRI